MARKQTLASLLGQSDKRVQVDVDVSQPTLTPTSVQGGAYNVVTQGIPKSNTAGQLANALGNLSPVLKEYGNIQEEAGTRAALAITDPDKMLEELKKDDPDTFLSYKRNQAYRNTLYKKTLNFKVLPALSTDSSVILNEGLQKHGGNVSGFVAQDLDPYLEKQWESFSNEVGDYANDPTARALWTEVTTQWRQQTIENYNGKIDTFNQAGTAQELGLSISASGERKFDETTGNVIAPTFTNIPQTLQSYDDLLADDGMIDPTKRTALLASEVAVQIQTLVTAGRLDDAQLLMDMTLATKINGKPVFKTADSLDKLNVQQKAIDLARDNDDTVSKTDARRIFKGKVLTVYEDIDFVDSIDAMPADLRTVTNDIFRSIDPDISDDQINQILSQVFADPVSASNGLNNALQALATNSGDSGSDLFFSTKADVNKELQFIQRSPRLSNLLDVNEKETALEEFREWKAQNPQKSAKQWITTTSQNFVVFDELQNLDEDLSKANFIYTDPFFKQTPTLLGKSLDAKEAALNVGISADQQVANDVFKASALARLEGDIEDYARTISDEPDKEALLQSYITQRVGELTNRYGDYHEALLASSIITDPVAVQLREAYVDAPKKSKPKRMAKEVYETIKKPELKYTADFIAEERKTMARRGDTLQLGRSLLEQGYSSWDPTSYEYLEETSLSVQDVQLFGSEGQLNLVVSKWREVFEKEVLLEPLTDEEEAIKDEFQNFGIANIGDLAAFEQAQKLLLTDTD